MARNLGWKMVVDSEQGRRLGAAAGGGGGGWGGRRTVSADPHSGLYAWQTGSLCSELGQG